MITTYLSNIALNLAFGATTWPVGRPATLYFGLFTAAPTIAGGGTEVSAGGYARVAIKANLALAAGASTNASTTVTVTSTVGVVAGMSIRGNSIAAGTTVASITDGTTMVLSAAAQATATGQVWTVSAFSPILVNGAATANLIAVTFPTATAAWGSVLAMGIFDAASGGNLLMYENLTPKSVAVGEIVSWAAAGLSFDTLDKISAFLQRLFLNHMFCGIDFIHPANHFISLGTGGTEAGLTGEMSGASYVRKSISNNTTIWGNASAQSKAYADALLTFAACPAGSWTFAGIHNHSTLTTAALAAGATTLGSPSVTVTSTAAVVAGMSISGTGIPTGTHIVSVDSATALTLSSNATATGSGLTLTCAAQLLYLMAVSPTVTTVLNDTPTIATGAMTLTLN